MHELTLHALLGLTVTVAGETYQVSPPLSPDHRTRVVQVLTRFRR